MGKHDLSAASDKTDAPAEATLSRRSVLGAAGLAASAMIGGGCQLQSIVEPRSSGRAVATRRVLWAANVRTKPIEERLEAAAAHGFTHMSMFPIDLEAVRNQRMSDRDISRAIETSGIQVLACDPFTQWVPRWEMPAGYPEDYLSFVNFDESYMYAMADTLGASTVNCVEPFGVRYETAELTDSLGRFADRASRRGLRVCLEFMPISGVPDLNTAWSIVRTLPSQQVGLTFDTWHFFRSDPDWRLLDSIPGDRIFEVQLADAMLELQAPTLTEDLLEHRRLPGDGEFPMERIVRVLRRKLALSSVGPEVFSRDMDSLSTNEAARRCAESLARWGLA